MQVQNNVSFGSIQRVMVPPKAFSKAGQDVVKDVIEPYAKSISSDVVMFVGSPKFPKIIKEIESCELEDCVSKEELERLQSSACVRIEEIIQNAKFMGTPLFDTPLSAKVSGALKGITFENPLALSQDFSAMKGFIEDKRAESNDLLLELSEALLSPSDARFESVDSTKLAHMFKS